MNMKNFRPILMGMGGGYLLYTANGLFENRNDPTSTMSPLMLIIFTVLFAIIGVVLIVYALWMWKHADEKADEEDSSDDVNHLK